MPAPPCPICHVNHWPREPHRFPADPKPEAASAHPRAAAPQPEQAAQPGICHACGQRLPKTSHRAVYQRQYMRKRRAAKRQNTT